MSRLDDAIQAARQTKAAREEEEKAQKAEKLLRKLNSDFGVDIVETLGATLDGDVARFLWEGVQFSLSRAYLLGSTDFPQWNIDTIPDGYTVFAPTGDAEENRYMLFTAIDCLRNDLHS